MAALLSVALFPIGLIAVMQTQSLASKAERNAELLLLSLTDRATASDRHALSRARGIADALTLVVPDLLEDPARCSTLMIDLKDREDLLSFAGFIPTDGIVSCSSAGRDLVLDLSEAPFLADETPSAAVTVNMDAPVSNTAVLIVRAPLTAADGTPLGYIALSVPHAKLVPPDLPAVEDALLALVTFNHLGELLTTSIDRAEARSYLPQDLVLTDLLAGQTRTLTLPDTTGTQRIYTVAAIEPGLVYGLGVWDKTRSLAAQSRGDVITALFPAVMWIAGLVVALIAVHRLVTRHLQVLGRQMALFTAARRLPDIDTLSDPPTEIRRIQRAFFRMTEALVRDEASLENAVREKSVLVKEIHHRVKNNLQLISSIINMQIRDATSDEAKRVLRRTQDRVLSMATIHRDLYQTNETGLVDVGHLVTEVVSKTIEMEPEAADLTVDMDVGDIWLYPDQAVPMSLLASETVVNALKHMPPGETLSGPRWLTVHFACDADRNCVFTAENAAVPSGGAPSRGMGRRLIAAFATQLGAKVTVKEGADSYRVKVAFTASEFAPSPGVF